jgi:hypothetical protein
MAQLRTQPALRRFGLYGLILLALALVSGVIFVLVTDSSVLTVAEAFPEPVILNPEKRPHFIFPESLRTYDLSLNQFVDRFARVCMEGKYSEFRLMLSKNRPPILPARFESNFNALKEVRILGLEKLPDLPATTGPVYVMKAAYDLQDFAVRRGERTKQVHVAIAQEDGQWRIGPIPREAMARLRAYEQGKSQPAEKPDVVGQPGTPSTRSDTPSPAPAPRTAANRPMRLDS